MRARLAITVRAFAIAILLAVLGAILGTSAARADEPEEVEEVVVRGSASGGFESRAKVEDAPRQVTDVASLIEPMPGVHVRRYGGDDSFASLSIRGTSSSEVAIVLAGVPLSGGADPSLDLATLPLWPGAQAKVYRSFAPASLGRGSLGGTLSLDPPSARAQTATESWIAGGSFGALRLRVGDVRAIDDRGTRVATAVSASRADDDFTYTDPLTSTPGHVVTAVRNNAGHADANALASLAMPIFVGDRTGALTVTTLAQTRRQELPGTALNPTTSQTLDSSRIMSALELTLPAPHGTWIAHAWGRREELALRDAPLEASLSGSPSRTDDAIVAAGGAAGWRGRPVDELTIDARVDGSAERYAPGTWIGAAEPTGATRTSVGAGADAEWRVSAPLVLGATGRIDAWSDATNDANGGAGNYLSPTGHLGAELALGRVSLAAHAGRLERPPSFVERYGDRGTFIGTPDLRPESAWTMDAGARAETRAGNLRLHGELVGFATWADDLIVFVPQGEGGKVKAENIGRARIAGIESELGARFGGATLRAVYTYLATENEGDGACSALSGPCVRVPLPGRPTHDLIADAAYAVGPVSIRYGVDLVSGERADDTGTILVPARVLQFAGARLDVPRVPGLLIALDVRNLFDVRTATYAGVLGPVPAPIGDLYEYPLPGRSFLLSARYRIDGPR